MGPTPKDPKLLRRRNKHSTKATLPTEAASQKNRVPPLPKRTPGSGLWHVRVKSWWASVWRSPMASEYLGADHRGLELLAELEQRFWIAAERGETVTGLASEIRQQQIAFGLTPMDRRRLQWEVERGEVAVERTTARKGRRKAAGEDPRSVLKVI